ncbi:MAG: molybdopterin molybdotransferase MoeA, partial [Terriglobales bacterium]
MAAREALSHAAPQRAFHAHAPSHEVDLEAARALVIEAAGACGFHRQRKSQPLSTWLGLPALPVLAEAARADRPWPPFRRAMRDGYALRWAEVGAPLRCMGEVRAGAAAAPPCPPGTCLAIMTGAPVPDNLDTVVMIEHTRADGEWIEFSPGARVGDNIAAMGSDSSAGALVAAVNSRCSPAALGAAAAAGVTEPMVWPPPRVAILATGDELVPASANPAAGQIRNSNGPMLAAQCRRYGGEVVCERLVPDDVSALERALEAALAADVDAVLFSGGASVGAADLVAPLLARRGIPLGFDAVRVRPGRPVLFGTLEGRLYFGLPGNPLGALIACALLVRPALERLAGLAPERLTPVTMAAGLGFD